jgi:hypothetical protein
LKQTIKLLSVSLLVAAVLALTRSGSAHAASFNVAAGSDETTINGSCSLSEAIGNINDQAQTNTDCAAGDGNNDTINLPTGKITLTADAPQLIASATIQGNGVETSIIDGNNGQYSFLTVNVQGETTLKNFKVQAFMGYAVIVQDSDLTVQNVDIDGTGAVSGPVPFSGGQPILAGLRYFTSNPVDSTVNVDGLYVHDLVTSNAVFLSAASFSVNSGNVALSIKNSTVANIVSTDTLNDGQVYGITSSVDSGATFSKTRYENITINNVSSLRSSVVSALEFSAINFGGAALNLNPEVYNLTITKFRSANSATQASAAILLLAGGSNHSDIANVKLKIQNTLVAESLLDSTAANCNAYNANSFFSGSGTVNLSVESSGGNISDDTTCNTFFNQSTDQNNLTSLDSTLGSLSFNGGSVPTRALLKGSPAIDAGVAVAGLTTDARLAVRPQGTAYDSGAYESSFSKAELAKTGEDQLLVLVAASALLSFSAFVLIGTRLRLAK